MKLVVTDMDGTLLNSNKEVPKGFFKFLEYAKENDIAVAIASGRQYFRLYEMFKNYDLYFIAENGASVYKGDQLIDLYPIEKSLVREVYKEATKYKHLSLVFAGVKASYLIKPTKEVIAETSHYCERIVITETIDEILAQDEIVKVAVLDLNSDAVNSVNYFESLKDKFKVVVSAKMWIDFNGIGVNKGLGLKRLMEDLKLSDEEVVVFGDYNNDIEMLEIVKNSVAMANATEEVKRVANYECLDNDHNGVLRYLEDLYKISLGD